MNELLWSMERKNVTALITLDLSAAFNMVDHSVPLTTLNSNLGTNGISLEWFENYLAPSDMKIKKEKSYSEKKSSLSWYHKDPALGQTSSTCIAVPSARN